jgi:Leucine-rich repeat (LRR) protein
MDQINEGLKHSELVQSLFLYNVDSLPASISRFSNLQSLELDGGKIRSLPPEFSSLRRLRMFGAYSCGFDSIPPEVIDLPDITTISIGGVLSILNGRLAPMRSLTRLYLSNNPLLRTVPTDIGSLRSLKSLDLNSTSIESMPDEVQNLSQLEVLALRYNHISPVEQARLRKLLPNTAVFF